MTLFHEAQDEQCQTSIVGQLPARLLLDALPPGLVTGTQVFLPSVATCCRLVRAGVRLGARPAIRQSVRACMGWMEALLAERAVHVCLVDLQIRTRRVVEVERGGGGQDLAYLRCMLRFVERAHGKDKDQVALRVLVLGLRLHKCEVEAISVTEDALLLHTDDLLHRVELVDKVLNGF